MTRPYAQERGSWVLARAGRRPAARRRGELLLQAARRQRRDRAGVGAAAATEAVTPGIIHRILHREHPVAGVIFGTLWLGIVLGVAGVGIAVGWIIYMAWVALHSRVGRPTAWPAVAAAIGLAVGGGWAWHSVPFASVLGSAAALWELLQPVVACLTAAWLTRAYGWPGVPRSSSEKRSDFAGALVGDDSTDDDADDDQSSTTAPPSFAAAMSDESDDDGLSDYEEEEENV